MTSIARRRALRAGAGAAVAGALTTSCADDAGPAAAGRRLRAAQPV
ncbi:hypothetical protein [Streptomyces sp. NPDC004726]